MSALETIVIVFVVISFVKIFVITANPKKWYAGLPAKLFTEKMNTLPGYVTTIAIGLLVLYHLLIELTITQILAASIFGMLLTSLVIIPYAKGLVGEINKDIDNNINIFKKNWLATSIWIIIMIWALWEIFI